MTIQSINPTKGEVLATYEEITLSAAAEIVARVPAATLRTPWR